jgi:hypothetical protein
MECSHCFSSLPAATCPAVPLACRNSGSTRAWPKPLPEDAGVQLVVGQVSGFAVDERNGTSWITHRPSTLLPDEVDKAGKPVTHRCCKSLPAVARVRRRGQLRARLGRAGRGLRMAEERARHHGSTPTAISGSRVTRTRTTRSSSFSPDGKFLMQIGRAGKSEGSNSRTQLGRPAHMVLDASANELYVADGYGNRRVVVFDAKTGAYKRHWGAYGAAPNDDKQAPYDPAQPPSRQFGNPVHCVRLSSDGLVYVCDRAEQPHPGVRQNGGFKHEFRVEPQTLANGSTWDMVLSHDAAQKFMYVADGANGRVYILQRADGRQVGAFGRTAPHGRASSSGCTTWRSTARATCTPPKSGFGRRIQKFSLAAPF